MTLDNNTDQMSVTSGPVLGYFVFRFALGINMFTHGAVRLFGDYGGFVVWVVDSFEKTFFSLMLVKAFGHFIPVFEVALGILLIFGLCTRFSLTTGGLFISSLIFGMCILQNWSTVADQMIYIISFYLLLHHLDFNKLSMDHLMFSEE